MPFKSQAQRKWMHATHPKMAARWEKESARAQTPKGRLPSRKPLPAKKTKKVK